MAAEDYFDTWDWDLYVENCRNPSMLLPLCVDDPDDPYEPKKQYTDNFTFNGRRLRTKKQKEIANEQEISS